MAPPPHSSAARPSFRSEHNGWASRPHNLSYRYVCECSSRRSVGLLAIVSLKATASLPKLVAFRDWRARATIARDRPVILLELLSGTHEDPAACATAICESFGYDALIVQRGQKIAAL